MKRIFKPIESFDPKTSKMFHQPVGITEMRPGLTMSVGEVVKRFTIPVLEDIERRSLLTHDFGDAYSNIESEDLLKLVDLRSEIRDFTDIPRMLDVAQRQIEEYKLRASVEAKAVTEQNEAFNTTTVEKANLESSAELK